MSKMQMLVIATLALAVVVIVFAWAEWVRRDKGQVGRGWAMAQGGGCAPAAWLPPSWGEREKEKEKERERERETNKYIRKKERERERE